eukprot:1053226-Pyramimonas_sp.AAC.2
MAPRAAIRKSGRAAVCRRCWIRSRWLSIANAAIRRRLGGLLAAELARRLRVSLAIAAVIVTWPLPLLFLRLL